MTSLVRALGFIVLFAVVTAGVLQVPAVQDRLMERVIRERMDVSDRAALFDDDALRLLVCGSSSPFPAPDRARPCLAVIAGGKFYVVDTGPGSWNRMALLRIPAERIGGVFITHFHSDHIGDLGEFNLQTWAAGRPSNLSVFGPPGVERVVAGFNEAYALDTGYRIAHHGAALLPAERSLMVAQSLQVAADGRLSLVFSDGDLKVTMFSVSHSPISPAVGYRFDYRGRSIAISGDTRKDPRFAEAARGVDVLAHEAQNQEMVATMARIAGEIDRPRYETVLRDIPNYHTSPREAAEIANKAGARLLLMYHLTPPPPNRIAEGVFLRGVDAVRPKGVELAHDGTLIEIPFDDRDIRVRKLK